MFEKIFFTHYRVVESQLKLISPVIKGQFKYDIGELSLSLSETRNEEGNQVIKLEASPSLNGYNVDSEDEETANYDDLAFSSQIKLELYFESENEESFDEKTLVESHWFFSNFLSIISKTAFESVLKSTDMAGIVLPTSRLKEKV